MERVEQVIMFCDIANFMRLSTALGERMAEFVQAFYETAGEPIVRHGGRILKYIGDSILSAFPRGGEREAVQCAIDSRRGFADLLKRYSVDEGAKLGAAISSGTVTRGLFGHGSLKLDDLMGEAVAHASILTRFGGITITEKVRDAVAGRFSTEELPPVPLKWKNETLRAWAVVEG